MLSPDTPPRFRTAIRLTALGGQVAFTFSVAIAPADVVSPFASHDRRELWFSVVGGTAVLAAWRVWGWIFRKIGICSARRVADELFHARSLSGLALRRPLPLDSNSSSPALTMTTRSQSSRAFLNESPPAKASNVTPPVLRAVIYARVSSTAQRDRQTIASQISTLPTFIASRGWILAKPAGTYVDDGRTAMEGFLSKRTSFTRLIQDAALGFFDVVVIVDMDRLTRSEDLQERGEVLGAFQRAGVQLAISSTGQLLDLRSSVGDLCRAWERILLRRRIENTESGYAAARTRRFARARSQPVPPHLGTCTTVRRRNGASILSSARSWSKSSLEYRKERRARPSHATFKRAGCHVPDQVSQEADRRATGSANGFIRSSAPAPISGAGRRTRRGL